MTDLCLTGEQRLFAHHAGAAFVEACPGSGKTRTVIARIARIGASLPARKGLVVLSFTNSATGEFVRRCHEMGIERLLKYPGFIGTFDAFLHQFFVAPGGIAGVEAKPQVVDSWESLGVEIRLRGQRAFRGSGVGLDSFDPSTNRINPDSIGHAGLRAHVRDHQEAYEQAAQGRRRALRANGYLSAADARVESLQRLESAGWSDALGRALAARFHEVIVDEAQDCNPLDLRLLAWLREHGVSVTVVADPDQAIYGFRHGDPADLRQFAGHYEAAGRLSLTGNFRSGPAICSLAATLRDRVVPDEPLGESADARGPVHILAYTGASVPHEVGLWFIRFLEDSGVSPSEGIVLAHARRAALRACGYGAAPDGGGDSKVAGMARAVGDLLSSSASGRARENSLRTVERMILDLMGKIEDDETPARAAERHGVDRRWLRRTALELVTRLPRTCGDSDADRTQWVTALHEEARRLGLTYRERTSERSYFRNPPNGNWNQYLLGRDTSGIKCATIHEAKGSEYEAVCVVIPPDRGGLNRTAQLLEVWENRTDDEAKRVVYVGVTRAKRLVALAVPVLCQERIVAILRGAHVPFAVHNLVPPVE